MRIIIDLTFRIFLGAEKLNADLLARGRRRAGRKPDLDAERIGAAPVVDVVPGSDRLEQVAAEYGRRRDRNRHTEQTPQDTRIAGMMSREHKSRRETRAGADRRADENREKAKLAFARADADELADEAEREHSDDEADERPDDDDQGFHGRPRNPRLSPPRARGRPWQASRLPR